MKSYTDLEQSKKLAEILPLESADMYYPNRTDIKYQGTLPIEYKHGNPLLPQEIGCWSLAALLDVLPRGEYKHTYICFGGYKGDKYISEWFCSYEQQEPFVLETYHADNPVDACVAMIEKLNELKLL